MPIEKLIHLIERAILIVIVLMTVGAVALEIVDVYERRSIVIADILLLFLYTEVISMVGVFYASRVIPVLYPLFIAITALSRLIVLQSKEMEPTTILFESASIAVLGLAAFALHRAGVATTELHTGDATERSVGGEP